MGEPHGWSNLKVVGLADLHTDVLAPLPSLDSLLWPVLWLIDLLELP